MKQLNISENAMKNPEWKWAFCCEDNQLQIKLWTSQTATKWILPSETVWKGEEINLKCFQLYRKDLIILASSGFWQQVEAGNGAENN